MRGVNREGVQTVPWPPEWRRPGGFKPTVGILAFGVFGVSAGIAGIVQSVNGILDDAIILLSGSPFIIALASVGGVLRLRVRHRSNDSVHISHTQRAESVTVIPNLRGAWNAMLVVLTSALVIFSFVSTVSWVSLAVEGDTNPGMIFQTSISTAFILGILWVFRKAKQGLFAQGGLTLSPSGVTYKAWGPTRHIPWYAAEFVFTYPGDCNIALSYDSNQVTVPLKQKDDTLPFSGQLLAIDPALAYYTLDFYLNHPEFRAELGTERSIERIRQANFSA